MRPFLMMAALIACSGTHELTPAEQRERIMERGSYCCTHDGAPSTPIESCTTRPGVVYLEDFSSVDSSGRGDACGWIWDGR